ncbi:MAG: sterol desaturase family protein [Pseudomonadales bacterium]|nr:sterol desaturase family protein [Pseudomonadales bacterium]
MNTTTQPQSKQQSESHLRRLFTAEMFVGESYRPIASAIIIIFAIGYAISFLGLMQYVAYLGPGLGDELNFQPYLSVFDQFYSSANVNGLYLPLLLFVGLSVINVIFTAGIVMAGYFLYPRLLGKPFPVSVLFTYFSLNAICTVGIFSLNAMVGLVALLLGYDFMAGLNAFTEFLIQLRQWAQQVPTLFELPAWLAFFLITMIGGFFHYWFHRLAHESRVLWLLFHRTHHMTPELIQPSAQAVFNAFPFFLFAAVPYVVIFSVIGKLITAEPLMAYFVIYKLFSAFVNLFSHQSALYRWAQGKWVIRALSTVTSEGVYHYLHHSAETDHNAPRGNLINIGGGLFFFWDRIFGTYRPVTDYKPRVGLQGIEADEMTTNPFRLAFAGIGQLLFELRYCQSLKEGFWVIFGGSDFTPQKSCDYVLKAKYNC